MTLPFELFPGFHTCLGANATAFSSIQTGARPSPSFQPSRSLSPRDPPRPPGITQRHAMAPKKKQAQPSKQNGKTDSFPGLKGPGKPTAKTHYQELQENELIALEAIYGDDFTQHSAAHSAWQVMFKISSKAPPLSHLHHLQLTADLAARNPSPLSTSGSRPGQTKPWP